MAFGMATLDGERSLQRMGQGGEKATWGRRAGKKELQAEQRVEFVFKVSV